MTDPEDKTGKHRNWADKIPLLSLLVFVFAAGGAWVEAKMGRKAVDDLSSALKDAVKEQREFNQAIDARQTTDEKRWIKHDAINEDRTERKKR